MYAEAPEGNRLHSILPSSAENGTDPDSSGCGMLRRRRSYELYVLDWNCLALQMWQQVKNKGTLLDKIQIGHPFIASYLVLLSYALCCCLAFVALQKQEDKSGAKLSMTQNRADSDLCRSRSDDRCFLGPFVDH